MNFFLKAKHWQIFVLLFAIPMLLYIGGIFSIFLFNLSDMPHTFEPGGAPPLPISNLGWWIFGSMLLFAIPTFLYNWTLGSALYTKIPLSIRPKINLFKAAMIVAYGYMILLSFLLLFFFSNFLTDPDRYIDENSSAFVAIFLCIFVLHFLAIAGIFFGHFYLGKSLILAEKQVAVSSGDYIVTAILFWFFPVGIWFIQPRVNELFEHFQKLEDHLIQPPNLPV